jgi:hypothetical protein
MRMGEQPRIVKIKIGKGQTLPSGPEGWIKEYYEIEVTTIDTDKDVQDAKNRAAGFIDGWLTPAPADHKPAPAAPPAPTTFPGRSQTEVERIRNAFAKCSVIDRLAFEDKQDYTVIRPIAFLQSEGFSEVAKIMKELGGDYISAGKDSHFRIPKSTHADADMLAKLPWREFKTKEPAKQGEAAWIYSNNVGAQTLVQLLQDHGTDTPVQIGDRKYTVAFSGDDNRFIRRTPI